MISSLNIVYVYSVKSQWNSKIRKWSRNYFCFGLVRWQDMKNIPHHFRFFFSFSPVHRTLIFEFHWLAKSQWNSKFKSLWKGIRAQWRFFFDRALNFEFHLPLAKVSEVLYSVKSKFLWFMKIFKVQSSVKRTKKHFSYHLFLYTYSYGIYSSYHSSFNWVVWKALSCELQHILNLGLKITRMKRQKY